MTEQEMPRLFESDVGEQRLPLSRLETDDELEKLHAAPQEGTKTKFRLASKDSVSFPWS